MTLNYSNVSPILFDYLHRLMRCSAFNEFYLAGGTALALQLGHRKSVDIDLFTCREYGTMDCPGIKNSLQAIFPICQNIESFNNRQLVYTIFVGDNKDSIIKLDLCYDEQPIFPLLNESGIRLASDKEIAAMKLLAIVTGDRPKDFWDIHALKKKSYGLETMIDWALKRNPYTLTRSEILDAFQKVWNYPEPEDIISLTDDKWPFIADDLSTTANNISERGAL